MKPKHKHHVFLGASIPHDTFEELDEHRGEIPRSVIVNHALQLYLAHVKGKENKKMMIK